MTPLIITSHGYLLGVLEPRPNAYVLWFCLPPAGTLPREAPDDWDATPGWSPEWEGSPGPYWDTSLAQEPYGYLGTPVGSFFDDIADAAKSVYGAAKGAVSSVASFVHHPPGWLAVALPLFTMENQRYWAKTLGGSTGAQLYDVGVKAVATKALGPQGPQLVDTYNKIVEDAAHGHVDALEILHQAPQIAKLAVASQQGPEAFRAAVAATKSTVKVSGIPGREYRHP